MAYGFNGTRPSYAPQQQSQGLLGLGGNKQFLGDALNVLGTSLLGLGSGRDDWGLLAMQGLQGRQQDRLQNTRQAQQDAQQAQLFEFQKKKYEAEQTAAQKEQASTDALAKQYPEYAPFIAAGGRDVIDNIWSREYPEQKPFTPNLQTINRGGVEETGYFDQNNQWVKQAEAPRWQQPQAPAPPERVRLAQAAGLVPGTPEYQKFLLGGGADAPKPPSAADLRKEYTTATKDYAEALLGYNKVIAAVNDPSPAGDIALIFGFMKTLDPNSTVREGEFATAQQTGGIPQQVVAMYNKALNGERLTPQQRADFAKTASGQFKTYQQRKAEADQFYTGLADRSGISSGDVLMPYPEAATPRSTALTPDAGGMRNGTQGIPQPKSQAERDALPSGTTYLDPQGNRRVKK